MSARRYHGVCGRKTIVLIEAFALAQMEAASPDLEKQGVNRSFC
jgi:hypothetical protein